MLEILKPYFYNLIKFENELGFGEKVSKKQHGGLVSYSSEERR